MTPPPAAPRQEEIYVDGNYLTSLPSVAGLSRLRVLSANDNLLTALPPGLASCASLEVLSLERNRISTPIADLRGLQRLHTLCLGGARSRLPRPSPHPLLNPSPRHLPSTSLRRR